MCLLYGGNYTPIPAPLVKAAGAEKELRKPRLRRADEVAPNRCIIAAMTQVPFQLDVEIRTPLAGGDIPTLDAVLLGEISRLNPDAPDYARSPEAALETLAPLLKITDDGVGNGIPHASALLFDARSARGEIAKITGRRRELWEVGQLGLKKHGGTFKATDDIYENSSVNCFGLRTVGHAKFFGVGDIEAIRRALSFWRGVGAQWRNGWGELDGGGEGWDITELPPDQSAEKWWGLVDENRAPVRPLPVSLFRALGGGEYPVFYRRVAPPYWTPSAPRVAAVIPDEYRPPSAKSPAAAKSETPETDPIDFLLNRFARGMRPAEELRATEKQGGKLAALRSAIEAQDYAHRGGKNKLRIGSSLFVAVGNSARFFSHAVPKGEKSREFKSSPPLKREAAERQKVIYDAAMTEVDGLCVIIEFPYQRHLAPEDIHVFSGRSDIAALSGKNSGVFSRRVIRRVLEIAKNANWTRLRYLREIQIAEVIRRSCDISAPDAAKWAAKERKRRKLGENESADLRELVDAWMEREREKAGVSEDDMFDLRDWLADMSPAGWAVLAAAPRFREKERSK